MKILQIMFLVLMITHKVKTNRLVENTTCLELAKPSKQQLRLTCSRYDYHCLLDETFTKEFEVCREWKWIPGGKCAYFNSYGNGNVDERECKPGINLICSESNRQFQSYKNTQFAACYKKKNIVTSIFTTTRTSIQVTTNWTTNRDDETPSIFEIRTVLPIAFGVIVPSLSVSLICSICMLLQATKKGQKRDEENQTQPVKSDNGKEHEKESKDIFYDCNQDLPSDNIHKEQKGDERKPPKNTAKLLEVDESFQKGRESSFKDRNGDNPELEPLLSESSIENQQTMRKENEDITDTNPERQKGDEEKPAENTIDSDFLKSNVEEENEEESTRKLPEHFRKDNTDTNPKRQKGDEEKPAENTINSDSLKSNVEEENEEESTRKLPEHFRKDDTDKGKSAESLPGSGSSPGKSDNEEENEEESTDVFDDTIESLQRITPPTDKRIGEMCTELYDLLHTEGLKLTVEVMAATISENTGKAVETLLDDLTDQDKRKLKEALPEEFSRILESKEERKTSFLVLYGLHLIYNDKEQSPKSGWGKPVRGKDIGIGDDVERLYRIQNIVREISNQETVSVESYTRLLDTMIKALARFNHKSDSEDFKAAVKKLKDVKNQKMTNIILKNIRETMYPWMKSKLGYKNEAN